MSWVASSDSSELPTPGEAIHKKFVSFIFFFFNFCFVHCSLVLHSSFFTHPSSFCFLFSFSFFSKRHRIQVQKEDTKELKKGDQYSIRFKLLGLENKRADRFLSLSLIYSFVFLISSPFILHLIIGLIQIIL